MERLVFQAGLVYLAIAMTEVEEIVDLPDYAVVPNTKPWFIGIGNVRGQLIPMTNLHHFAFGQPMDKDDHARLLVCMREEVRVGLLVGEVLGLRRFYAAERQATSDGLHPILNQFADGTFGRGDDCCSVIDMQQLMGNREFLEIGN